MSVVPDFVVAPENEQAYREVRDILSRGDTCRSLFVFGAKGSGKSTLVKDADRVLGKSDANKFVVSHAAEVMLNIQCVQNELFLQSLVATDVLVLDDFQDFLESGEAGELAASTLLHERNNAKKQTVLFSSAPISYFRELSVSSELANFDIATMSPLDGESKRLFVEKRIDKHTVQGVSPRLDEEAKQYLADSFSGLRDLDLAIMYLMTESGLSHDELASKRDVEALLKV